MNKNRVKNIKKGKKKKGPVVYWMSRDQRTNDNWALLYSQETGLLEKEPLIVVFCLTTDFSGANIRNYDFMLRGLKEVEKELNKKNITFYLINGDPAKEIPKFIKKNNVSILTCDFSPLKIKKHWLNNISKSISIPFYEIDTRNIVPCQIASPKKEYGAYTIRPKIHRLLPEFLDDIPKLKKHPFLWKEKVAPVDWKTVINTLKIDRNVSKIKWLEPGEKAAKKILSTFLTNKISKYDSDKNDPNKDVLSNLSPYLHFGQISSQRVVYEVQKNCYDLKSEQVFLEEIIVRRELSDNFCFYEENYDSFEGFPSWAKKTLNDHRGDIREYLYSEKELEEANTHDQLWNAAQIEMVKNGKMHGYMRMYWAKKILEWTNSPEEALKIAIYLNDKYELDGRDPNGYTGISWSIGAVHDRAWKEREIFGKIRYMSYNGCKSKFKVKEYIKKHLDR